MNNETFKMYYAHAVQGLITNHPNDNYTGEVVEGLVGTAFSIAEAMENKYNKNYANRKNTEVYYPVNRKKIEGKWYETNVTKSAGYWAQKMGMHISIFEKGYEQYGFKMLPV